MTAVAFKLPLGVLVWQAVCPECEGGYGVLAAKPPEGVHPRFCPFCARRTTFRLAYNEEVPVADM